MSSGATQALFVTGTEPGQIRVQNKNEPSTNLLALILLFCWIEKLKVYPVQCLGSLKRHYIYRSLTIVEVLKALELRTVSQCVKQ